MREQKPSWWIAETSAWIAVNKPAGISVEKTLGASDTVQDQVLEYLHRSSSMPFLGIVHRLDRVTSGILLLAKKKSALRKLNEQFASRQVKKTYLALVEGVPAVAEATLSQWLYKDQKEKKALIFDEPGDRREACQLQYRCLTHSTQFARLEIVLDTGKFHQIRAQLAAMQHPVVGDEKYGARLVPTMEKGIALHAHTLAFIDPIDGQPVQVEAPIPNNVLWK